MKDGRQQRENKRQPRTGAGVGEESRSMAGVGKCSQAAGNKGAKNRSRTDGGGRRANGLTGKTLKASAKSESEGVGTGSKVVQQSVSATMDRSQRRVKAGVKEDVTAGACR